jgi:mannan endo-1,4-beta-mannosidase
LSLNWIRRAPDVPYFIDDFGQSWTPIGQNDAIEWVEFNGLLHRRDLPSVERHLRYLADSGVTCLRFMLEYAEKGDCFFEQPAGRYNPVIVQLWDDLFRLVEQAGLRLLLTPMDTYFHWVRWEQHPYNAANGGPCAARTRLMVCPDTRALIKARLEFAARRWGGSGALFAWDLWNEMHPVQGEDRPNCFDDYISDVSPFLRAVEREAHGRDHLQCVSVFGPELHWKPWLNEPIFRHPMLDFANNHLYEEGTIDHPGDTVAPARAVAQLMREALEEITDRRPFFDTEHGPIHTFKDHRVTLPEEFDDEYFRHIQWTHLACGGAGGGMRWPNRHPHTLTPGMRRAQRALADFLPLIDWPRFQRRIFNGELSCSDPDVMAVGCGDAEQAVLCLLRQRPLLPDGRLDPATRSNLMIQIPGLAPGDYRATIWNTTEGRPDRACTVRETNSGHTLRLSRFGVHAAVAVRRI